MSAGFRAALLLRVLLPWYVCLLLIGLLQTWPLWTVGGAALRNPLLADLAAGGFDAVIDLFLDNPAALAWARAWALLLVPATLAGGLVYTFFAGGVLSVYTGSRSFWAGCRRFWWPFAALGGLIVVLAVLIAGIAVILALVLGDAAGLVVALVGLALLNVVAEYARAIGVLRDRRNPFVLLGDATMFCVRHLGGVLGLALCAALLYALLVGTFTLVARLLGATPLVVFVQQLWVFGALWIKGLRLAWAAAYVSTSTRPPALPSQSPVPLTPTRDRLQS